MPPPSSGGVALIEMLNILEPFDLKTQGLLTPPRRCTSQIEAMRRAYLDRARYLGDPDFVEVPVTQLTSKAHAREVAATIDPTQRLEQRRARQGHRSPQPRPRSPTRPRTSRSSTRTAWRSSNTYTLEGGYGSHVVVKGAGFLLNNEMGDFNKKPGTTNVTGDIGTPANLIAPGKRMLSSMTPTIVAKDGKVVLVTGSPGGRTIINTVLDRRARRHRVRPDRPRGRRPRPACITSGCPTGCRSRRTACPSEMLERLRAMGHEVQAGRGRATRTRSGSPDHRHAYGVADKRSDHGEGASLTDIVILVTSTRH